MLDPRTPVLVGCGQVLQRAEDPAEAEEPLGLMIQAALRAAEDAGAPALLGALDSVRVPRGLWRYANPGALLRERFGAAGAETGIGPISGSTVQVMVSDAAREIAAGRRDVVLVVGGECEHSKRRTRALGGETAWTVQEGPEPERRFGPEDPGFGWWEKTYRVRPIQTFALYENALRHHRGESPAAHRECIAALWERFARIATRNPYAWIQDAPDAATIATPSDDNRMVAYPYTKLMVANMVVDQGAALILCSVESARRFGVPEDRFVYPQAATDAVKVCPMPERVELYDQPAMGLTGRRALELAGADPGDIDHVDLYSCFPSAVQIAALELGFDLERDLSVTGGLTFAGGPFNSYVLHALATLMDRVRADPGSLGFLSSVGGYMAKHAFGLYGTAPPESGFRYECLDDETLALPTRSALREHEGLVTIEAYTVLPDASGAADRVLAACRTQDGERTWATNPDPQLHAALGSEELCGRSARTLPGGTFELR
jgi:acetyl-CoA C-acetyltransferase